MRPAPPWFRDGRLFDWLGGLDVDRSSAMARGPSQGFSTIAE